jgi:hypothetical protein
MIAALAVFDRNGQIGVVPRSGAEKTSSPDSLP